MRPSFHFVLLLSFSLLSPTLWAKKDIEKNHFYTFKDRRYPLMPLSAFDLSSLHGNSRGRGDITHIDLSSYPRQLDLKEFQSSVKNQGSRNSCTFFVAAAIIESMIKKSNGIEVNLSEEYINYATKKINNIRPDSEYSNVYANLYSVSRSGAVLESDYPYQASKYAPGMPCYKQDPAQADSSCNYSEFNILPERVIDLYGEYYVYEKVSDEYLISEKMVESMAKENIPLSLSVLHISEDWDEESGVISFHPEKIEACLKNQSCGGHAVLATGYDLEKRVFYFKNSWGKDWGDHGYGTIPFDYVDNAGGQKIILGMTAKEAFKIPSASVAPSFDGLLSFDAAKVGDVRTNTFSGVLSLSPHTQIYYKNYFGGESPDSNYVFIKDSTGKPFIQYGYSSFDENGRFDASQIVPLSFSGVDEQFVNYPDYKFYVYGGIYSVDDEGNYTRLAKQSIDIL